MAKQYLEIGDTGNELIAKWQNNFDLSYEGIAGLGYIITVSDNIADDQWWLTKVQVYNIFTILYDYDFGGVTVNIPGSVTLLFNGGVWGNGTIIGDSTSFHVFGQKQAFEVSLTLGGLWLVDTIIPQYYGAVSVENITTYSLSVSDALQKCIDSIFDVFIPKGYYYFDKAVSVYASKNIACSKGAYFFTDQNIDFISIGTSYFYWVGGNIDFSAVDSYTHAGFRYDVSRYNNFYGRIDCNITGSWSGGGVGVFFDDSYVQVNNRETHFIDIYGNFRNLKYGVYIPKNVEATGVYVSSINSFIVSWQLWQTYRYERGDFSILGGITQEGGVLSESDKMVAIAYSECQMIKYDFQPYDVDFSLVSEEPYRHNIIIENGGPYCILSSPSLLFHYRAYRRLFIDTDPLLPGAIIDQTSIKIRNDKNELTAHDGYFSLFKNAAAYANIIHGATIKGFNSTELNVDFDSDYTETLGDETVNIRITNPNGLFLMSPIMTEIVFLNEATKDEDFVEIVISGIDSINWFVITYTAGIVGDAFAAYFNRMQLIIVYDDDTVSVYNNYPPNAKVRYIDFGRRGLSTPSKTVTKIILRLIGCDFINSQPIYISELLILPYRLQNNNLIDIGGGQTIYGNLSLSGGIPKLLSQATYADNTAAKAGGLVAGDTYRTSAGVLMVVYD